MRDLRADGLRQGIPHRTMIERSQQPPAVVHSRVAHYPDHGSSHIRSEDGIFRSKLIEHLGHIWQMNRKSSRLPCYQAVQILACCTIAGERGIQVTTVPLLLNPRQQRAYGFRNATHQLRAEHFYYPPSVGCCFLNQASAWSKCCRSKSGQYSSRT